MPEIKPSRLVETIIGGFKVVAVDGIIDPTTSWVENPTARNLLPQLVARAHNRVDELTGLGRTRSGGGRNHE